MDPNLDISGCSSPNQHHAPPPDLCANGCSFFGSAATRGLCSLCYKDECLREEKTAKIEAATFRISPPLLPPPPPSDNFVIKVGEEKEIAAAASTPLTDSVDPPAAKSRCDLCRRKLGVLGFACRCGGGFCDKHRLPEAHACRFDYKGAGKIVIVDQNPVVKADKMTRRI